jgi:hypothetical protein
MEDANIDGLPTRELLSALDSIKHNYSPGVADKKLKALHALRGRSIRQASLLLKYHEALCYLQAYPDNRGLLALVEEALGGFDQLVQEARRHTGKRNYGRLDNTGIAGTAITHPFSYVTARWLAESFPADVSIAWNDFEHEQGLLALLPLFVSYLENEAIDDQDLETKHWLTLGQAGRTDLTALIELLVQGNLKPQTTEAMYELLELYVRWRLRAGGASRTLAKLPGSRTHYQTTPLSRRKGDLVRQIGRPLAPLRRSHGDNAQTYINASRVALAVRLREMVPLIHVNPQDVWVAEVGRGVEVVLMGALPRLRMPIECTYFFLLLKNGVPVGYGSGSALADRAEVAANIFDSFRGGESAFIYAQVLRVFHHAFGSSAFLIDRGQIGYENSEGIGSGAFWFYYKMGFRPVQAESRKLAEAEASKVAGRPGYHTPAGILRQLANSDMLLSLTGAEPLASRIRLGNLGRIVTSYIGKQFGGNRSAATRSAMSRLRKVLPMDAIGGLSGDKAEAVRRFSPLVVQMPGIEGWRKEEKEALVQLMAAKGGTSEIPYARQMTEHRRFLEGLCALSRQGEGM